MENISIRLIGQEEYVPEYSSLFAAGADLKAAIKSDLVLEPGDYTMVNTGLKMEIPNGYEAQVRPRSGLAAKHGVTVLNSPGTIDSDYRGEIKVILINHGKKAFKITNGDRIAQMIISPVTIASFRLKKDLEGSIRGAGGFGSTGMQ